MRPPKPCSRGGLAVQRGRDDLCSVPAGTGARFGPRSSQCLFRPISRRPCSWCSTRSPYSPRPARVEILGFWVYVAIFAAVMVASFALLDPGLLRERMRPGGQRPPLALRLFTLVLLLHWIVAGLDRGRFHWSDNVPAWLRAAGLIAVAAGYGLALWAMLVNRFFSSVVRIQSDRGQYVVTRGLIAGYVTRAISPASSSSWRAASRSARGWRRRC